MRIGAMFEVQPFFATRFSHFAFLILFLQYQGHSILACAFVDVLSAFVFKVIVSVETQLWCASVLKYDNKSLHWQESFSVLGGSFYTCARQHILACAFITTVRRLVVHTFCLLSAVVL